MTGLRLDGRAVRSLVALVVLVGPIPLRARRSVLASLETAQP